jgi:hypothetical protein
MHRASANDDRREDLILIPVYLRGPRPVALGACGAVGSRRICSREISNFL